jgi:putative ABC transport system permease protein
MISAQWLKVLYDLWGNKTRTILIVLSIAVGLFATGAILNSQTILAEQMAKGYAATHPASGTLRTREPFDEDFLRSVRAMKDVQEADARRSMTFRIQAKSGQWLTLRLLAMADYSDIRVNQVWPQSGDWPPPEREVLIERGALDLLGAQMGDRVLVETADEKQRALRIAGLTHDLTQFPARFTNAVYGYVSFDTLEWLGEPYGFNTLHIVTRNPGDKAAVRSVLDAVETKAKKSGLTVLSTSVDKFPLEDMVQSVLLLLSILGVLSLCLSAFLIVNTVSALLAQQVRQIGVMKAIGARTLQILGMYLAMVMLYGLVALVIAAPLGIGAAYVLCRFATSLLNFDLASFRVPLQTIALQAMIGLVVPVLASLYPFISGLRVTAAEAMSTYGVSQHSFSAGPISRLFSGANVWFARRVLARPLLLSLRNTFRSRVRLSLTLTTLTLAGAIFISVFSVRASLFRTINDLIQWRVFDSMLTFTRPYRAEKIEQEALRVPGVVQTDVWIDIPVLRVRPDKSESDPLFLLATRADSGLVSSPFIVQGRWLAPEDENAIVINTYLLKKEPDVKLGDEMVLKIGERERTWRVVGVCLGQAPPVAYANYAPVTRLTGNVGRASTVAVTTQQHDQGFATGVTAALESHYKDIGLRANSAETTVEERAKDQTSYGILVTGLLAMAVLFAIVGGLGLMGTMSINVIERTREIGVMRAIGAPTRSVAQVFVVESVAIGVLSWLFGTLLALPLSKIMSDAAGMPLMGTPINFTFSLPGVGLWLVVVVVLSVLASFIPARSASRLTVREVLAYE